jgi:hypothetical protein
VLLCMQVVAAFVYYGLVMLVPQLEFVAGESKQCVNGHLTVPVSRCQVNRLVSCTLHATSVQQCSPQHLRGCEA